MTQSMFPATSQQMADSARYINGEIPHNSMKQQILIKGLWVTIRDYTLAKQMGRTEMLQSVPDENLVEYAHLSNVNFANNIRYFDLYRRRGDVACHENIAVGYREKNDAELLVF